MVPNVSITRARGSMTQDFGVNFRACVIGYSSKVPAGYTTATCSTPYGSPDAIVTDFGIGDGVDAVCQMLTNINGDNPSPPAVTFVSTFGTASLTAGVRGATLTTSGVVGTTTVTKTASTHPAGTWEGAVVVVDDGNAGAGTNVGTAGIVLQPYVDAQRTKTLPTRALGTAVTFKIQITIAGVDVDTGIQYDFTHSSNTLKTGDVWTETKTVPPQWAVADLFTAGSPPTGALYNIMNSGQNFGVIAITEPVLATDITTLSTALTSLTALKASFRPTLIVRFRDQAVGESDATYTTALATFRAACADDARIVCVAGDGWLTDAYRGFVFSRTGTPALLARRQGNVTLAGRRKERIAQDPGYAARGPLPGFSIKDTNGNPVGHDEKTRPGAETPVAGKGGFLCFFYEGSDGISGTYVAASPSLYPSGSAILSLMDNAVSSAIERILYNVAFAFMSGAEIVTNSVLDNDAREAMANSAMKELAAQMPNEFANATDPNLVTVGAAVTVSGSSYTVSWYVNDKLYFYTKQINITIANAR